MFKKILISVIVFYLAFLGFYFFIQKKPLQMIQEKFFSQNQESDQPGPEIMVLDDDYYQKARAGQPGMDSEEKNTIEIYEKFNPIVVNITTFKTEYVNFFFDVYPQTSEGQGSGVVIDREGHIITNYHVVGNADKLNVALSQGTDFEARIIGTDPENDLAVIKLINPPLDLTLAQLGHSDQLKIGQKVYAIGNPFGLDRTLTAGIISALSRTIKTDSGTIIEGVIQTDASINPGNSGGPLLDSSGRVIGINTMIISPSQGSVGLGFAIPINKAREVVPELIKYGYVRRGWIDATYLPINSRIARALDYPTDHGIMIMQIARAGEADKAGLKGGNKKAYYGNRIIYINGDIITSVNGKKIVDYSTFVNILKDKKPGEIVEVVYYRGSQKKKTKVRLIDKRKFTQ